MKRISSIDATRGIVMLLMLVDHAREFFYMHAQVSDPVDIAVTSPSLFFTRFAAHLCAPIFILLTGLSSYLYAESRGGKKAASEFLLKRGLFMIVLEVTIVSFGWSFSIIPSIMYLQVIWAIGLSMICLSGLIWLPRKVLIFTGIAIVLGHNLLDSITFSGGISHTIWAILHERTYIDFFFGIKARVSYPVLPWIGLISMGFAMGPWFSKQSSMEMRSKNLLVTSAGLLSLLLLLRFINIYGEPLPWSQYPTSTQTLMSFLNFTKYPPSADFILFTTGIGLLLLWCTERFSGTLTQKLAVFGSAPLFFYVIHIYALNIINTTLKAIFGPNQGTHFSVDNVGTLWLIMAISAIPLWYLCRWYARVKKESGSKVLSYF